MLLCSQDATAGDWLQWRGPLGTGVSDETGVPQKWSQTENIRWKVELDGEGNSSPIVVDSKVLITHAPTGSTQRELRCYDRNDGSLLWTKGVEYSEKEVTHQTNPLCAGSPVSDGERIVAWFGSAGLYCFDLNGEQLWNVDTAMVRAR
jgi:outer membrane protein assembly factor BamB